MTPFCGYNMGDYFQHWFNMGDRLGDKAPKIFYVNWFRKSADGHWLWPGFGDNVRALKWMCERIEGKAGARKTAIGYLPSPEDLDLTGLKIPAADVQELLKVDPEVWKNEVPGIAEYFAKFGERLPKRITKQLDEFKKRLGMA
ncbi:MAG: phosphoenolpyruvate carboxykinase (GTP), partial [Chloroflexi bacterium]|nr:phosphoenolpyruvate carboxykinase (GTP) [Chloroflexota bacterium]